MRKRSRGRRDLVDLRPHRGDQVPGLRVGADRAADQRDVAEHPVDVRREQLHDGDADVAKLLERVGLGKARVHQDKVGSQRNDLLDVHPGVGGDFRDCVGFGGIVGDVLHLADHACPFAEGKDRLGRRRAEGDDAGRLRRDADLGSLIVGQREWEGGRRAG